MKNHQVVAKGGKDFGRPRMAPGAAGRGASALHPGGGEVLMRADDGTSDWRDRGACVSADPDLFFPISSVGASCRQENQAKAVCARCEVRPECLQFALDSRQVHGVWGGLGEAELARVRRNRQRAYRRRADRAA